MNADNLSGICSHSPKCLDWQTHNLRLTYDRPVSAPLSPSDANGMAMSRATRELERMAAEESQRYNFGLGQVTEHSMSQVEYEKYWDKGEQRKRKRKRNEFIAMLEDVGVGTNLTEELLYMFDKKHAPTVCEGFEHISDTRPYCSACGANRIISDKSLAERDERWKNG